MGAIIGGIVGGIGSLIGGSQQAKADKQAAQQALTGYNYLTSGAGAPATTQFIQSGANANNMQAQLLGAAPVQSGTQNAFNNYLNSTGYNFQLDQGRNAIEGSMAARGVLNSGATAKALQQYGQGLASTTFNNYLTQLGGLSSAGQTALGQVASSGTGGGATAAKATAGAGQAQSAGINGALQGAAKFANYFIGA